MRTRIRIAMILAILALIVACARWTLVRFQEKRNFLAKLRNIGCLYVSGVSSGLQMGMSPKVDGICCDTNRIALLIRLIESEVKLTTIRHWGRNQGRDAATYVYLEVFNASQ